MYFEFVLAYSSIYNKAVARSVSEPLFATLPWLNQADFEHLISAKVSIAREVSYFVSRFKDVNGNCVTTLNKMHTTL